MAQLTLADQLLATIAQLKSNPALARSVFRAETQLVERVQCRGKVRDFPELTIDEPEALGGTNSAMNPVELVLIALGACQEIMYAAYAAVAGIQIDQVSVNVKGFLDVQGLFGLNPDVPPGFQSIEFQTSIASPESSEKIQGLVEMVESHCPVLDTLVRSIPTRGKVLHNGELLTPVTPAAQAI